MDPALKQSNQTVEEDEWDTRRICDSSLSVENSGLASWDEPNLKDLRSPPKEQIYLGPHGAPPQSKQQDLTNTGRKKRFKQKLKEADRKYSGTGRENKAETIRELVGGKAGGNIMLKSTPREWLDPHCHESQFERYSH
ncbi:hypothetical protein HPP92_005738 [Vanilla planifolia]|uniref:Uncharacterized protein n=1 Tax=Vanilla planifolia TaxID=51239 RepID=A0A835RSQ1_VANPL|nr:hypothetical protein HPP92_005738 [Vanilla planifolia]